MPIGHVFQRKKPAQRCELYPLNISVINNIVVTLSQFGKAIVCSDAAAEAARYGFTAVDRPEGFLVLAVASLGNDFTEVKRAPEVRKNLTINIRNY